MKEMLTRVITPVLAIGMMLTLVTACNPDPAKDKAAADVTDEVVTPEPAAGSEEKSVDAPASETGESAPEEPPADAVIYTINKDNSVITFIGSKPTANHTGGWSEYSGTVTVPDGDFTKARIDVEIDMTSTYSDDADLTEKLIGEDFFEVDKFPASTFKSTKIVETDDGYKVSGNLTLHGITKNLTFPAKVEMDEDSLTAEAEFSFDRKIFEIDYDGLADDLIRDKVLMTFYIEANAE